MGKRRSILSIDINGTGYLIAGGEGHPASEPVDTASRYRRLPAFPRDRLAAEDGDFRK